MLMDDSIFYTADRAEWRAWLEEHFETEKEIWFVFPMKESGEASLSYNDAVEEALCFGWIDSTIRHIDALHRAQHFTPRKGEVGIKDFVSFGVGDFVLMFHNFFPPSMYFSIAVRLIVHRRSSNNFAYRKDTVYKEIIRTLLLSEKSSDYLNLV